MEKIKVLSISLDIHCPSIAVNKKIFLLPSQFSFLFINKKEKSSTIIEKYSHKNQDERIFFFQDTY
jgi:hypothetical protein